MTRRLVCYDVTADARRRRVATLLESYGRRLQQSVFVCRLTALQERRLRDDLRALIDADADALAVLPLCARCAEGAFTAGTQLDLTADPACFIV